MTEQEIHNLLQKYQDGTSTPQESQLLENWYNSVASGDFNDVPFPESLWIRKAASYAFITSWKSGPSAADPDFTDPQARSMPLWKRIAAVAAILLVLGSALVFILNRFDTGGRQELRYANEIQPGRNRAVLTLANGRSIDLDQAKNGNLATEQDHTLIRKTADGQLVYESGSDPGAKSLFNTMSTPKGGQYALTLSDGTKVMLNAGSHLRYPAEFRAKERIVELSGEAYFQVAHDSSKPFKVISRGQLVEVLGTHFNIEAYPDETATRTTLETGSVRLNKSTVLSPGQQAVLRYSDTLITVKHVAAGEVIAWKDGLFVFEDEPLQSIMRKVERWYDVRVSYASGVDKNKLYGGSVSRYDNVSKILEALELTKSVHFKIEGRRITVMK